MRKPYHFILLALFLVCSIASARTSPNVILFLVDDMGLMDTSVPMLADQDGKPKRHPLNDWYRTPNMERLAKQGILDTPFDGVDLLPTLTGKAELKAARPLFFRRRTVNVRHNRNVIRQSAVRKGDWKYLRTYKPIGSDKYQSALYHLGKDIAEEKNLATANPQKMKALSNLLDQGESAMSKTAVPFLKVVPKSRPTKKENEYSRYVRGFARSFSIDRPM